VQVPLRLISVVTKKDLTFFVVLFTYYNCGQMGNRGEEEKDNLVAQQAMKWSFIR
jgi:hypothetical protein